MLSSIIVGLDEENTAPDNIKKGRQIKNIFKVVFGAIIGIASYIIITYADFAGVKMICNIGAFPSLIIHFFIIIGAVKIMANPDKYDET